MPSKRLYVGNIPYQTSEEDLRSAFAAHGEVTAVRVITDRETGRSRGFAFVEMDSVENAGRALDAMNGAELGGRTLRVNEAHQRRTTPDAARSHSRAS